MDKKIIKLDDTEIEEYEIHQHKSPILINDIYINEIVVSNKLPFVKQDYGSCEGYGSIPKLRFRSLAIISYIKLF